MSKKKKNASGSKKNRSNKINKAKNAVISIKAQEPSKAVIDIPVSQLSDKEKHRRRITGAIAAVNAALLCTLLAAGSVYMTCFKHETKAEDENRMLAKMPDFSLKSYFSGDYTEEVADYFDDTVHGRSDIKKFIADKLMPLKGRSYGEDEVELYGQAFDHSSSDSVTTVTTTTTSATTTTTTAAVSSSASGTGETETAVTTTETTTEPPTTTQKTTSADDPAAADGEISNNILIVNKRGITLYGGGYGCEVQYAQYLNEYAKALPDVNVYSMVLPTSCSYYLPDKYKDLAASEKADFDRMGETFEDVTYVDAYTALEEHKDEAIYSRTDHHWQPLGAYYAAQEFAKAAGVPFDDLEDDYETVTLPGYVGTLYNFTQSSKLLNNPEDFVYYIPKREVEVTQYNTSFTNPQSAPLTYDPSWFGSSGYYMVFGSDDRIAHVKTDCKNGRTLVIFKDSYGNALLPMLTGSFENIYLCDIRYFDLNAADFIKKVGATDLLFSMCSYSAVGVNRTHIYNNLHK